MTEITVEGYLTEPKLVDVLKTLSGDDWRGGQLKLPNSRRRWDCAFQGSDCIVAVEYDGERHYINSLKIKADREKNALAAKHGIKVVRFPYWIQLTSETLSHYLGLTAKITQDFPHGFITTEWYPASFCELGVERFQSELARIIHARRL
jgi:hypothetical protein